MANSRFFALDKSPGQLGTETWIEIDISQARLVSDVRLVRDHPSTVFGGTLTYDCVNCIRSYLVTVFRDISLY
jgi:hypothetical protein